MRYVSRLILGAFAASFIGAASAQTPPTPATPAPATPAPATAPAATPDVPKSEYLPLTAGTKWTYKVGESVITVKVDKAATATEGATLNTEVNDKVVASETLVVKADGIYRTKINRIDIVPPVMILKFQAGGLAANKGDKWKVESKIQDQQVKGEFTIRETKEKVTVPAGEFEAVVVEGPDFEIAGTKTSVKYWFVWKRGIVKLSYSISGNEANLELKDFSEGK